jgi:hypothetical protein
MDVHVTLLSHHGDLDEVRVFQDKEAALAYARKVVADKGFEEKHEEHDHEHEDEDGDDTEELTLLGNWGDADGCGMIVAVSQLR